MNGKLCLWLWFWLAAAPGLGLAQSSGFTYQGRLLQGGIPANGSFDLQFRLTDAATAGNAIGSTDTVAPVPVTNGLFTVTLDFGAGVFDGGARWLEISVRPDGDSGAYTLLAPRQAITASPYSSFATTSATAAIANSLVFAAPVSGNGDGLTNLNGSNISAGTITSRQFDPATWFALTNRPGATPANLVWAVTNAIVSSVTDTNTIIITRAEDALVNGRYACNAASPVLSYTNALFELVNTDRTSWGLVPGWNITDFAGDIFYIGDGLGDGAWYTNDAAPTPSALTAAFVIIQSSNSFLTVAGARVPTPVLNNDLYVDANNGSDLYWQRGNPYLPLKTIQALQDQSIWMANDTVHLAAGVYPSAYLYPPPGIRIIGAGRDLTFIGVLAPAGSPTIMFCDLHLAGTNCVMQGFTLTGSFHLGDLIPVQNLRIDEVDQYGYTDGLYLNSWDSLTAVNSSFGSPFDSFADFQGLVPGRQSATGVATFYNCALHMDYATGGWNNGEVIAVGTGTIRMYGGTLRARLANAASCVCVSTPFDDNAQLGHVELYGVNFDYANTNGVAWAISNRAGAHIKLTGTVVNPADVYDPFNMVDFGYPYSASPTPPGTTVGTRSTASLTSSNPASVGTRSTASPISPNIVSVGTRSTASLTSSPPSDLDTVKAYLTITNTDGQVFKLKAYQ